MDRGGRRHQRWLLPSGDKGHESERHIESKVKKNHRPGLGFQATPLGGEENAWP